ncbi:hypothetical protein [Thomasclavelia sp.]|uniref:hypothetical protein n=1 Tax=Thomasclavelia sp. TaxID=3025757 RepID=UPI0025FA3C5C|nr:hypothetical protein [Thomasclavelia sp.]
MKIKSIFNRIANVLMAILMVFTTVNIAGIQPIFGASSKNLIFSIVIKNMFPEHFKKECSFFYALTPKL